MTQDLSQPHIVCHLHTQTCSYCHAEQTFSQVYLCETLDHRGRKLHPLKSPAEGMGLPAVLVTMPPKTIAYCHICIAGRPQPDANAYGAWQDTLRRKRLEIAPDPKPTLTIDDLD